MKNLILEFVIFFEMYGVECVEELNIVGCWVKNEMYKSFVVLFGLCGKDDIV